MRVNIVIILGTFFFFIFCHEEYKKNFEIFSLSQSKKYYICTWTYLRNNEAIPKFLLTQEYDWNLQKICTLMVEMIFAS